MPNISEKGELLWARRFGGPGENDQVAFAGAAPDGGWVVAGNYKGPGGVVGTIIRLDDNGGSLGGVSFAAGAWMRITGVAFTSGGASLHGEFSEERTWFARARGPAFQTDQLSVLEGVNIEGFLPSTLLLDASPPRFLAASSGAYVDVPVATDGRVGCATTRVVPIVGPLEAQPAELSLTRTALRLVGGEVPDFADAVQEDPMMVVPATCE